LTVWTPTGGKKIIWEGNEKDGEMNYNSTGARNRDLLEASGLIIAEDDDDISNEMDD